MSEPERLTTIANRDILTNLITGQPIRDTRTASTPPPADNTEPTTNEEQPAPHTPLQRSALDLMRDQNNRQRARRAEDAGQLDLGSW